MKKIIAALLTAIMTFSTLVVGVNADNHTNTINEAIANNDEIHILMNDTVVECDDVKPINEDGRVMIPFRQALESMGASVDYNDAERMVTATKGAITITFVLMDDVINVNNNGEIYTITMDTPMMIVNERTLVPIRFMSNAFNLQIGWDGATQTVIIVDATEFMSEFQRRCPNLYKLSQLNVNKVFNKADFNINMESSMMGNSTYNVNMGGELVFNSEAASADINYNVESPMFNLEDARFSVVFDGETVYLRTDVFEKLQESMPQMQLGSVNVDGNTWYSVNLVELCKALKLDEQYAALLEALLSSNGNTDIEELLRSIILTDGDASLTVVISFSKILDMLELIDKYVTVTETGNGFIVTIEIPSEVFREMMNASLSQFTNEQTMQAIHLRQI